MTSAPTAILWHSHLQNSLLMAWCKLLVPDGGRARFSAPVVPGADAFAGRHQVVVIDALNDHARRPGFQNVIDGRIGMNGEHAGLLSREQRSPTASWRYLGSRFTLRR